MSGSKTGTILDEDYEPTEEEVAIAERILERHRRRHAANARDKSDAVDDTRTEDPKLKEQLLDRFRQLLKIYSEYQAAYAREAQRIDEVLATATDESVNRAATWARPSCNTFKKKISSITEIISDLERFPTVLDAIKGSSWDVTNVLKQVGQEFQLRDLVVNLDELRSTIDAIKFAVTADHGQAKKASQAMEKILSGVTVLQKMGFEIGEIQATVDDYIGLRTRQEFTLLGRVVSDANSHESNKNILTATRKREELIAQNKWVRAFLNKFWLRYWRNAFEQSLSDEHESNIQCAVDVIPGILDALQRPTDKWTVGSCARREVTERRARDEMTPSRVRFRYEHEFEAIARLLQSVRSDAPSPLDVVQVEVPGDVDPKEPNYWTRQRAEAAGLKIVPPERVIAPADDTV